MTPPILDRIFAALHRARRGDTEPDTLLVSPDVEDAIRELAAQAICLDTKPLLIVECPRICGLVIETVTDRGSDYMEAVHTP